MQQLGIQVTGILRWRTEDQQAILNNGYTFAEFQAMDDQLNTIVQIDLPNINLLQDKTP